GFGDGRVADKRTLHFHRSDTMARNIDHIVDAAHDPEITVFIAPGAIAREIHSGNLTPVLFLVSFGISINRPQHRRPGTLDNEKAALISSNWISMTIDDIDNDTRQWSSRRSRLGGNCTGNGRDHDRAGFSLPPGIDDRTGIVSDVLSIPNPGFGIY